MEKLVFKEILFTYDEILSGIKTTAKKLNNYYKDKGEVLVVPILDGSIVFCGQILPMLDFDLSLRATKITSYGNNRKSNNEPKILLAVDMSMVKDKTILILEDMIDTGQTLAMFKNYLLKLGAKDVKICVLFKKDSSARSVDVKVNWTIFDIPNAWVAGFGIDSNGKYRNARDFGIIE